MSHTHHTHFTLRNATFKVVFSVNGSRVVLTFHEHSRKTRESVVDRQKAREFFRELTRLGWIEVEAERH
jgi:hypothetical protein